jgi:hypothetical protein
VGALAASGLVGTWSATETPRVEAQLARGAIPFALDRPIQVDLKSRAVAWKGQTYHLVRLGQAQFQLSPEFRLTASLKGGILTFDKVDYDLSAAVFGATGELLGTARTTIPVERVWLGHLLTMSIQPRLDFGISQAYREARSFALSLSERRVLTPDEWQREG